MGIFSRKAGGTGSGSRSSGPVLIGRKFHAHGTFDECISTFEAALAQCYPLAGGRRSASWVEPEPGSFQSTQGGPAGIEPALLLAYDLSSGGTAYLAAWQGTVTRGAGGGKGGPPFEFWFVPPGFSMDVPMPLAGTWKMALNSLSSVGNVERPLWGVRG